MIKSFVSDVKGSYESFKNQSFAFYMACGYIIFSYLRPQVTFPIIDILPWTQLCIMAGFSVLIVRRQFEFSGVHFIVLMMVIVVILSTIFSLYPEISRKKLSVALIWFGEVLFFVNCIRNKHQLKLILILFFLIMFKMSYFGAKTWVSRGFGFTKWGIAGPDGYFSNSGEFSLLMAMVAMMAIGFLTGLGKLKSIYCLLPITAFMTVLGASSRGSQLAVIAGGVYLLISYRKLSLKYLTYFFLIGYIGFNLLPEQQMERFRTMGDDNTSQSRLEYWEGGIDMMKKYPLLGVGFYGFGEHYFNYYKDANAVGYLARRKEVAHNSFIEIGSSLGFSGLFIYLLMLGYVNNSVGRVLKVAKSEQVKGWIPDFAKGMRAALIVYIVGSSFMSVAFYPYIYLMMMFAFLQRRYQKD